jgi:hypothetical protein
VRYEVHRGLAPQRRGLKRAAHRSDLFGACVGSAQHRRQILARSRTRKDDHGDATVAHGQRLERFEVVVAEPGRADDDDWGHTSLSLAHDVAHDAVPHLCRGTLVLEWQRRLVPLQIEGPRRHWLAAPRGCAIRWQQRGSGCGCRAAQQVAAAR